MPLRRLILRYALLQLPGFAVLASLLILLRRIVDFPAYAAWGILAVWIAKDIVLFPILGRYYDPDYRRDRYAMIGRQGVVQKPLTPKGTVRIRGELWRAEAADSDTGIDSGQPVVVINMRGLTLQVAPISRDSQKSAQNG